MTPSATLALAAIACCTAASANPAWPSFRGSPSLLAHSSLKGDIREPHVIWKHFVGTDDTYVVAGPEGGADSVGDPRWTLPQPEADIAGRRQVIPRGGNSVYADALPDAPGFEKLEFESGFNIPTVNGQWQPAFGRCFAWRGGKWEQAWQTDPINMLFASMPLAGDFDGDGKLEIAILPWYELLILDAATGKIKDRCRFTEGRSYGYFGAYDLDGDGKSEFIIQADFCKHIDVLGYKAGKLSLLCQKVIEADISNPQKISRANPRSVADVDGDGKLEVSTSIFNDTGDGRWHLIVFDGMTGAVKADLPDEHLQGVCDVNGDGVAELLTAQAKGGGVAASGTIRVRTVRAGQAASLWESPNSAWATWDPAQPLNVNSGATFANREAMCRPAEGGAWAVAMAGIGTAGEALRVLKWGDGGFATRTELVGPGMEATGLDAEGRMLVRCSAVAEGTPQVAVTGGVARTLAHQARAPQQSVPVVAWEGGKARVIVQGAGEELVALTPPTPPGEGVVQEVRFPGRGQSTNWPADLKGPVVANLFGDERRQVLYATSSPAGCGRLVAEDLQGREVWHHDFLAIPGTQPIWNTGGVILWQTGHLTDPKADDVVVTVRRSMMHSEETYALSGRDGRELWHRDRQISNRGVGGTPFAIADFDGDGLDDVASLHPSIMYILKGSTGKDILAKDCNWPGVPAQPVYWGLPIAGDFDGTGQPSIFFATANASMTGLLRRDGTLAWWDAMDKSPYSLPAFGDFDGDGKLEAMGWGYPDGIRCYDTATGKVKWTLAAPEATAPSGCASADLNGDGKDEAVFAVAKRLYCVGNGAVLWKLDLPAWTGPPSIADVDGSGKAAIVVAAADGWVYCVK